MNSGHTTTLANQSSVETIVGTLKDIKYSSDSTGFVVIEVEIKNQPSITASGLMPDARKGIRIDLHGLWISHPKYGNQFNFTSYHIPAPEGEEGAIAFLATLKGIGETIAKRIVEAFGDETFEVLENESDRLLEVKGIGEKMIPDIVESFQEAKTLSELIGFLHRIGVSVGYAPRIYKKYGEGSIPRIKRDPYVLSEEVRGFGFKRADQVALGLGIPVDHPVRLVAAILHVLKEAASLSGHCFLPRHQLETAVRDLIALPAYRPIVEAVRNQISELKNVAVKPFRRLVEEGENVYLFHYHQAEVGLAAKIQQMAGSLTLEDNDVDEWIDDYEEENDVELAPGQREAVRTAVSSGISVVTGGAGTGKTTISKAIIQFWSDRDLTVIAVAPTGRAAQRIKESTGLRSASTIHRLLGWSGGSGFAHHAGNPVEGDAFLVDESSMMDLRLAYSLFEAIPRHAVVVLIGDVNQLPSVGAGNVLRDAIASSQIPVVRLTEIFRQAATSRIIQASLAVNEGRVPELEQIGRDTGIPRTDALWVNCPQAQIPSAIKWLLAEKLPSLGWSRDDIQCLSPTHKCDCGNIELNKLAQELWNPPVGSKPEFGSFREGDRVIQTSNDYSKRVFNGDIGKIECIDLKEKQAIVRFPDLDNLEGRIVEYTFADLADLMLAYSVSVHKAQGSEFPVIIVPVSTQQYMMLQRNLYYTAITRGKKLVVIVGEERPLQIAVRNNRIQRRNTLLAQRIQFGHGTPWCGVRSHSSPPKNTN